MLEDSDDFEENMPEDSDAIDKYIEDWDAKREAKWESYVN